MSKKTKVTKQFAKPIRTKLLDPRLKRVFEVIDEAWDHINTGSENDDDSYLPFVLSLLHAATENDGAPNARVKAAILALQPSTASIDDLLEDAVKHQSAADEKHRAHCACCKRSHAAKEAA